MSGQYRADHVGSLLRPPELLEARRAPSPDPERLKEIEDRHILRVLARQKELGFDVFTDGETRRRHFMSDLTDAVEGFDQGEAVAMAWQQTAPTARPAGSVSGIVTGTLRQRRRLTAHEVPFLKAHSPGAVKVTLPSATQFPAIAFKRGVTDRFYPNHSALLRDLVAIIKAEVQALAQDGVDYIQIDAPRYSYYIDPKWRVHLAAESGMEPDASLDEAIRADNTCLEGTRRPGVNLAIHLCRGNREGHWFAEGGYDPIAEKLFSTLQVDRFLLEYDDERSGTFAPLRFVPQGKTVVLGLVSSKRPQPESRRELITRIEEASRYVPLEHLAISPQCGFGTTEEGAPMSEDAQWAKLGLVAEVAREVWK